MWSIFRERGTKKDIKKNMRVTVNQPMDSSICKRPNDFSININGQYIQYLKEKRKKSLARLKLKRCVIFISKMQFH